jgi:phosphoglycolate phosphatase-like HAD superfamily hydrolase
MVQRRAGADDSALQRAVIFDFDGTIADSLPAILAVFEDLTGHSVKHFSDDEIDQMRDLSPLELMKLLEVPKWKAPYLLLRGRQLLRAHMHGIAVHDGMADTIKALHKKGVPLYVLSSNSTDNVTSYLKWHKLHEYFAGVHGGASIFAKAPGLLKLIKGENVSVSDSWYVGDETRDVTAAKLVGLQVASVTWGFNTRRALIAKVPDAVVDTAKELDKVLKDVWKK